jgi:AcrR family transcriptional regulator
VPRHRTVSDERLLDVALEIVHGSGPSALSFATLAGRVGLAASTIVQRFGSKANLLQAALLHAWDRLDTDTAGAIASAAPDATGVVDLFVALSGMYDTDDFADQLMVLREDLRDPVLRDRGKSWIAVLAGVVEERLRGMPGGSAGLGELLVAHWQGTCTVWSFTRSDPLPAFVRRSMEQLLARLTGPAAVRPAARRARRT